jgi:hypothetical protein
MKNLDEALKLHLQELHEWRNRPRPRSDLEWEELTTAWAKANPLYGNGEKHKGGRERHDACSAPRHSSGYSGLVVPLDAWKRDGPPPPKHLVRRQAVPARCRDTNCKPAA